jgi:transcriptional regulator with XRE-family HTH domain
MNFLRIIARIKQAAGVKTDAEVASLLGMKRSTLAERKRKNSIPFSKIARLSEQRSIPLDWLLNEKEVNSSEEISQNQQSGLAEQQAEYPDSRRAQADLRQIVDKFLNPLGELLEGIISRLDKIDGDHEKCRKALARMESEEESPGPSQPSGAGDTKKEAM